MYKVFTYINDGKGEEGEGRQENVSFENSLQEKGKRGEIEKHYLETVEKGAGEGGGDETELGEEEARMGELPNPRKGDSSPLTKY